MRKLSNGLIVSLATADLLVAILVLPLSLQYEVAGRQWLLGKYACDFWITADVFCCSASILNIVVIAADRYWLITRNVRYTHGTPFSRRRVCAFMIVLAWLAAGIVSCAPFLGGWRSDDEHGVKLNAERASSHLDINNNAVFTTHDANFSSATSAASPLNVISNNYQCIISQDLGYTIFSTSMSFWLPLSFIVLVYARIFYIARRRARMRARARAAVRPTVVVFSQTMVDDDRNNVVITPDARDDDNGEPYVNGRLVQSETIVEIVPHQTRSTTSPTSPTFLAPPTIGGMSMIPPSHHHHHVSVITGRSSNGLHPSPSSISMGPVSIIPEAEGLSHISADSGGKEGENGNGDHNNHDNINGKQKKKKDKKNKNKNNANNKTPLTAKSSNEIMAVTPANKTTKQQVSGRRLRNSARTLGLIIGGFVICWLPFFILATFLPFCGNNCHVPEAVNSVVLWLGYSNSLMNPIIYAIWDKSFQQSFRRLARCDVNWRSLWQ